MAIDRGPWNALVDDDGSNLVGTIWNKDKIKTVILDPTDAALAPPWILIPHNPAMYTAAAGSWTVSAANQSTFRYCVIGKIAFFALMLQATSNSASTPRLWITLPAGVPLSNFTIETPVTYATGATGGTGQTEIGGGPTIGFLRDILGTPWPVSASGLYLRAEWFYQVA